MGDRIYTALWVIVAVELAVLAWLIFDFAFRMIDLVIEKGWSG